MITVAKKKWANFSFSSAFQNSLLCCHLLISTQILQHDFRTHNSMFKFVVKICLTIFGHILFRSFWSQYSFTTQTFGILNEYFHLLMTLFILNCSAIPLMPKQLSVPTTAFIFSSLPSVFFVTGQSGLLLSSISFFFLLTTRCASKPQEILTACLILTLYGNRWRCRREYSSISHKKVYPLIFSIPCLITKL